jgi:hypothetical protein
MTREEQEECEMLDRVDILLDADQGAQLCKQMDEDAQIGRALREYFAKLAGWGVMAELKISLVRYDLLSEPAGTREDHLEPHWWIYARMGDEFISNDGKDKPDCLTLLEAMDSAGLIPIDADFVPTPEQIEDAETLRLLDDDADKEEEDMVENQVIPWPQ